MSLKKNYSMFVKVSKENFIQGTTAMGLWDRGERTGLTPNTKGKNRDL